MPTTHRSSFRVGVYVDVTNLAFNGGFGMRYDVLRQFAVRGGGEAIRLNAYVSYDADRVQSEPDFMEKQTGFHSAVRDVGFKVIEKEVRWFQDETGTRICKSNVGLDMAVDALLQSEKLDRVLLATGDGDFTQVVKGLQNRGCRVEVVAFENVSGDLRREADLYMSGYLIPNLLPIRRNDSPQKWGEIGSFVRGVFYAHDTQRGFGWVRYLTTASGDLWVTDAREPGSPYATIFCHDSDLPESVNLDDLPNRNMVFEFQIVEGNDPGKRKAVSVECIRTRT